MSFNLLRQVESVNSFCSQGCPLTSNLLAFPTLQRWDNRCALPLASRSAGERARGFVQCTLGKPSANGVSYSPQLSLSLCVSGVSCLLPLRDVECLVSMQSS